MATLGYRSKVGALSTSNFVKPGTALWVITFTPSDLSAQPDFEVWHGTIRGPGGYFIVYIEDQQYGVGENGLINEYAPSIPMYARDGQTITLQWSIGTGAAPKAWLYLRQPEVGKL